MTDAEKIEAEARANAEFKHPDKPDTAYFAFLDGVAWRDANPSPEVAEVIGWAQAVLTALNVCDITTDSPMHLKLREVMITYRKKLRQKMGEK